jgi:hypothetical protein
MKKSIIWGKMRKKLEDEKISMRRGENTNTN